MNFVENVLKIINSNNFFINHKELNLKILNKIIILLKPTFIVINNNIYEDVVALQATDKQLRMNDFKCIDDFLKLKEFSDELLIISQGSLHASIGKEKIINNEKLKEKIKLL